MSLRLDGRVLVAGGLVGIRQATTVAFAHTPVGVTYRTNGIEASPTKSF
jgi:hypothetical protein